MKFTSVVKFRNLNQEGKNGIGKISSSAYQQDFCITDYRLACWIMEGESVHQGGSYGGYCRCHWLPDTVWIFNRLNITPSRSRQRTTMKTQEGLCTTFRAIPTPAFFNLDSEVVSSPSRLFLDRRDRERETKELPLVLWFVQQKNMDGPCPNSPP